MKKTLFVLIYGILFGLSNIAYGLGSDIQSNEVSRDAYSALQATRSMVHADLEKNTYASFKITLPTERISIFGIDDTKSYVGEKVKVLGHLSIEG